MKIDTKDYTPTAETVSLHGLGFVQVKLQAGRRLHVWHPDLPRRDCYKFSAIHNHRFAFRSTVLKGVHRNQRCDLIMHPEGSHAVISHDGPRSPYGGRLSFPAGNVNVLMRPLETYMAGCVYETPVLEYHHTPNDGIVITLMEKLFEGEIHASSVIERSAVFHMEFDRFQLSPAQLWGFVTEALAS